ncbi:MAG: hypothetical protein OXL37_17685 [Chloroflexota bacterium]|nr:hypothetical protein [Chloroflexota bacterium]MDE2958802.1 hypothetical protein [Chloroflexota bacterium]
MATITQQTVILDSQNQVRNADRLAREWAIAHAGAYQGQARRELGGSLPFREWKGDALTIRIAKLSTGAYKQVQLVSVNHEPLDGAEPYAGYVVTYGAAETERPPGRLIAVTSVPDTIRSAELPWDDKAGLVGLERVITSVSADRSRQPAAGTGAPTVAAIDDLFDIHDAVIVLTEDGQREAEFREMADGYSDWASVVPINASEQIAISRELPDDQLGPWVRAKIALFSRYADANGIRLRLAETDCAEAEAGISAEREHDVGNIAGRNAIDLLKVLESASIMLSISVLTDAKEVADVLVESTAAPAAPSDEAPASDSVAAQQRIYVLEDQLQEAKGTIAELRERLAQYESYDVNNQPDEDDDPSPESIADSNRYATVLNAVTSPGQFSRLRFLTNWDKTLPDYGKPRPSGTEIVAALDAINKLAQAWHNTPGGGIGPWDNYFNGLTGWTHANGESSFTMSRYGDKRSFSDQEQGRQVTIERHLTYRGSSGGLQIYFDKDDVTDTFIVGYIGEHLPYATNRS